MLPFMVWRMCRGERLPKGALPYGVSRVWLNKKGWRVRDMWETALREFGLTAVHDGLRELVEGWRDNNA